jgi:hypothetical protein
MLRSFRLWLFSSCLFAGFLAEAGTFTDNFASGLNPAYWSVIQTTPGLYTNSVSQGNVQLAKTAANNPGALQAVYIRLNFASFGGLITNDFSAQISFSNAVVPGPGLDQVELHTYYENGSVYFASFDNSYNSLYSSAGWNAHVWDGSAAQGLLPLSTNAGTFTISRTGGTVTGYFNGTSLYSETRSSPLIGIDFILQNNNGSQDATSVSFNHFSFTSSSILVTPPIAGDFYPVNIANSANFTWAGVTTVPGEPTVIRLPGAPVGLVTLAGLPFNIASDAFGNEAWHADIAAGGNTGVVSLTAAVNVYAVTNVYSLINTWDGQPPPTPYAWFVFTGSEGTVYTNFLVGGVNIRDYNGGPWENIVTSSNTINVFDCLEDNWGNPGRLDMQEIALPAAFATQSLVSIELVDNGGPDLQRTVLDGLTVQSAVPQLSIVNNGQGGVNVLWPVWPGIILQTNSNLVTAGWAAYGGPIATLGNTNSATFAPATGDMFFRLSLPLQ